MNARQKAKKLKKELEELKADKTNGCKWLKIDGLGIKREAPNLWYDNTLKFCRRIPNTYEIRIGHTTVEITLENPEDKLIVIDSKKLDEAIRERECQGVIP
jgi:hypothetical protein